MTDSFADDGEFEFEDNGELRFAGAASGFADAVVSDARTASDVHDALFSVDGPLHDPLFEAGKELAERVDGDRTAFLSLLDTISEAYAQPAAGGAFMGALVAALSGGNRFRLTKLVSQFGDNTYLDVRTSLADAYAGPMAVFRASTVTPTVVVQVPQDLFDTDVVRREARERWLAYLSELARGCDVRLVATGRLQTRFVQEHRAELPAGVIESADARLLDSPLADDTEEAAVEALGELGYTDSAWDVLRVICEGRTDSARYGPDSVLRTDSRLDFGRTRLSQCLSTLEDHGLIIREGPQNDRYAIATPTGTAALEALDEQIGKQAQLDGFQNQGVSETRTSTADPCNDKQGREGGSPPSDQDRPADNPADHTADGPAGTPASPSAEAEAAAVAESGPTRYHSSGYAPLETLSEWEHQAAVAAAPAGGVGVDDVPIGGVNNDCFNEWTVDRVEDNRSPLYSFDRGRQEIVAGAEFHDPLQYGVCLARALLSPLAFQQVLTPERLDGEAGALDALMNGNTHVLRDKRCLGYLKEAYDGEEYQAALQRGIDDLLDLSGKVEYGDYSDDQRDLRSEVLKLAHGLIGTVTAIYDLLGVDVTRAVRLPGDGYHNLKADGREALQHFMVRASTISSKMGAYTQSRVQFEPRDDKREAIGGAPTVDADDPFGTHIGQWSVQGHGATNLCDDLSWALEHPEAFDLPLQVDEEHYADFIVEMPVVESFARTHIAEATTRMCNNRSLRVTNHAVNVMQAFTGSIHDITKALAYKSSEDGREVRLDDLKYALSTLPASRILPTARGNVKSAVVHTLIGAAVPLSQTELTNRAGVTDKGFTGSGDRTDHREELQAFGVIRETDAGFVVCLPYRETDLDGLVGDETARDDGRPDTLPWFAEIGEDRSYYDRVEAPRDREESLRGGLYEAMLVLEAAEDLRDPDNDVVGATYGALTRDDLATIIDERPSWTALVNFAVALAGEEPVGDPDPEDSDTSPKATNATIGRPPDQASVREFDTDTSPTPVSL